MKQFCFYILYSYHHFFEDLPVTACWSSYMKLRAFFKAQFLTPSRSWVSSAILERTAQVPRMLLKCSIALIRNKLTKDNSAYLQVASSILLVAQACIFQLNSSLQIFFNDQKIYYINGEAIHESTFLERYTRKM